MTSIRYLVHVQDPCYLCLEYPCPPPQTWNEILTLLNMLPLNFFPTHIPHFKNNFFFQVDKSPGCVAVLFHTVVNQGLVLWSCHFKQIQMPYMKNPKHWGVQGVFLFAPPLYLNGPLPHNRIHLCGLMALLWEVGWSGHTVQIQYFRGIGKKCGALLACNNTW